MSASPDVVSTATTTTTDMFIVDSFTKQAFSGNPAAVCLLPAAVSRPNRDRLFQTVAREMCLSETAFVTLAEHTPHGGSSTCCCQDGKGKLFHLQWFTPTVEVPLCGHATIASAHVLFKERPQWLICGCGCGGMAREIVFRTRHAAGDLRVRMVAASEALGGGQCLEMEFPRGRPRQLNRQTSPLFHGQYRIMNRIFHALSLDDHVEDPWSVIVDVRHCEPTRKLLIEVNSLDLILKIVHRQGELTKIDFRDGHLNDKIKGIIITTCAIPEKHRAEYGKYDVVSRYFAPWLGIPEDPVNGSSHTTLVVHYSQKLGSKCLLAFQRSERGGELEMELVPQSDRMLMRGNAVTILRGSMDLKL